LPGRNSKRKVAGVIIKENPATELMLTVFRLCRAAMSARMAISAMSANMATGGVPMRTLPVTPTTATCATTSTSTPT